MDLFDESVEIGEASTPEEMRAEIFRLGRSDPMTRNVLVQADFSGLSAEDKYTTLAYFALVERNRMRDMLLAQLSILPNAVTIRAKETK